MVVVHYPNAFQQISIFFVFTLINTSNVCHCILLYPGPGVIRQLLDELEKNVKFLEDRYAEKVKAYGVRPQQNYHTKL